MHFCLRVGDTIAASRNDSVYNHYISKAKIILDLYDGYLEKYQLKSNAIGNYYSTVSSHFARLGYLKQSLFYAEKALESSKTKNYSDVSLMAAALHDKEAISNYVPIYYEQIQTNLKRMLPLLGSVESDTYLMQGQHPIYNLPELASWNPTDSISVVIAYNSSLLIKGLTLRYNVLSPFYDCHPELVRAKRELDRTRDSIYTIPDNNDRLLALHRYELRERELLKSVNEHYTNICWQDVKKHLKENC